MTAKEISERIRKARLEAGMTQQEMAEAMHVSTSTFVRFEEGKSMVISANLTKMAKVVGKNEVEILAGGRISPTPGGILEVTDSWEEKRRQLTKEFNAELAEKDRIINGLLRMIADNNGKTD